MGWEKVSKEVIDKTPEIIPLKKGELQVKYAEALVRIDEAIVKLATISSDDLKDIKIMVKKLKDIKSILQDEEVKDNEI